MGIFDELNIRMPGPRSTRPSGVRAEAEGYAASLGLTPGGPGWGDAIREFVRNPLSSRSGRPTQVARPMSSFLAASEPETPVENDILSLARDSLSTRLRDEDRGLGEFLKRKGSPANKEGPSRPAMLSPAYPTPEDGPRFRRWRSGGPPKPWPFPRELAGLSEGEEDSQERGVRAISTGENDRGGVSYGASQLATETGTAADFVRSPEARRWQRDFRGLRPGTPEFSARWTERADREPDALDDATFRFTERTHYRRAIDKAFKETGFYLDHMSDPLRAVIWSTAVQHGPSRSIISDAINNLRKRKDHFEFEPELIREIYRIRGVVAPRHKKRYAREQTEALRMHEEQRR